MIRSTSFFLFIVSILAFGTLRAEGGHPAEEYEPGEVMLHHVLDTHNWHFTDIPAGVDEDGNRLYTPIEIPLPWLFWDGDNGGLRFFANTQKLLESGEYIVYHDKAYSLPEGATYDMETHGTHTHGEAYHEYAESVLLGVPYTGHDEAEHVGQDNTEEAAPGMSEDEADDIIHEYATIDFSPTKLVVQMIIVLTLITLLFIGIARAYQKREGQAPKGFQSAMEPIITFIRDDIAKVYLHNKADAFMPFLLTVFFFIWFSNLAGITPLNSNIMGNISVTFTLALFTFILTQINGTRDYWRHIFAMPGVPKGLLAIITPIELFGLFTKPIALMIRLFANIAAGHFMILALVSLIFILGREGTNLVGSVGIAPLSVLFTIFIFCLEIIVGLVQAYVFTLLSAVFIGQAMESHGDHH